MVMPGGMTGLDLTEWTVTKKPDLKVVCMSGYSNELVAKASPAIGAQCAR
jgi:YesN/AraC family two-component response regulator